MKSLGIIKDDVYNDFHFRDNDEERRLKITETEEYQDEVTKRFAKEVAKQALINASEKAKLDCQYFQFEDASPFIDKQSILNESNIPKL